jgi:integrase
MTEETTQRPHRHPLPEETREHLKAAREEMRKSVETLLPPGFLDHRRAARKEFLLAARSFLDAAIKRMDEK